MSLRKVGRIPLLALNPLPSWVAAVLGEGQDCEIPQRKAGEH